MTNNAFRDIKNGLTHAPALGVPDLKKSFFLFNIGKECNCFAYLELKTETRILPNGILLKKVTQSDFSMATMPEGSSCYKNTNRKCSKSNFGTKTKNPDSPSSQDSGDKWLLVVKRALTYQVLDYAHRYP